MIEYLSISIFSFLAIFSLSKIISYHQRFDYLISITLITFISLIALLADFFLIILISKICLILILIFLLFKKKVKFSKFDFLFFSIFLFLLYFNYGDQFYKQDVINGYGHFTKAIFYSSGLPHYENLTNFKNYNLSFLAPSYYNFYLAGLNLFREDVVILSHNIFIVFCIFTILKSEYITRKNIFSVIFFIIIFYLLIGIFFQNGKNILSEEITISLIFALTIFLLENKNNNNKKIFLLTILFFLLIGFGKKSNLFLLIFPISTYLIFQKNKISAYFKIIFFISTVIFSYNLYTELNSNKLKEINKKFFLIEMNLDFKNLLYDENDPIINIENYGNLLIPNLKIYPDTLQKILIRYNYYSSEASETYNNKVKLIFKDTFDIEVYKASILPPVRYLINSLKINYKFPRLSIKLLHWLFIISIIYFLLHFQNQNNKSFKNDLKIFYIISLTAIFINTSLVLEDLFYHNENINLAQNTIAFHDEFRPRDTARYLGWSIFFSINIILYLIFIDNKKFNFSILIFILIFLLIVSPLRTYAHVFKILSYKENTDAINKNYKIFKNNFLENCKKDKYTIIADTDPARKTFQIFIYRFHFHKFLKFYIKDEESEKNFANSLVNDYSSILKNNQIGCIIVKKNSLLNTVIKQNLKLDRFKLYKLYFN